MFCDSLSVDMEEIITLSAMLTWLRLIQMRRYVPKNNSKTFFFLIVHVVYVSSEPFLHFIMKPPPWIGTEHSLSSRVIFEPLNVLIFSSFFMIIGQNKNIWAIALLSPLKDCSHLKSIQKKSYLPFKYPVKGRNFICINRSIIWSK